MLEIKAASVTSKEATELMKELSEVLETITGCGGALSFDPQSMKEPRTVFLIAYLDGKPVGCGALKKYDEDTAEIKRVYSKVKGNGSKVLKRLEEEAICFGYKRIILETRKVNGRAVQFYLSNGYEICPNYGKYQNREEAVCFCKTIKAESLL